MWPAYVPDEMTASVAIVGPVAGRVKASRVACRVSVSIGLARGPVAG